VLLEPITRLSRREAIAYVARRPYENVFLQWVLEGGHGPGTPDDIMLSRDTRNAVTGVVYFGTQLVLAADDDPTVDAFAIEARRHPGVRSFVGPVASVNRLWERVSEWHKPPLIVREYQPLYVLARGGLRASGSADVRPAHPAEAETIAEQSALMMLGELGYDPRSARAGFLAGVRYQIDAGNWWVWMVDGQVRFQCSVGARTRSTAQIQGVWTPPSQRGRGYATLALGAIARRLLESNPTLSLYVNDFNSEAIALYERLGFVASGAFATYLFP
jgi:ribosomal protein S18 acetylase RimI-like enzyme